MKRLEPSSKAEHILDQIDGSTKRGDLRKMAKDIGTDHGLAMELWATNAFIPRLLAILIIDPKALSPDLVDTLTKDMGTHFVDERNHLMDWLMANQLTRSKKNIAILGSWESSPFSLQRRAYWYYQGRLRWTGQTPPDNTESLLSKIGSRIMKEEPEVQWAMNFTAGWIGVHERKYRKRCIELGKETGLYKDEIVSRGCTPNYLPAFISIEAKKRNL